MECVARAAHHFLSDGWSTPYRASIGQLRTLSFRSQFSKGGTPGWAMAGFPCTATLVQMSLKVKRSFQTWMVQRVCTGSQRERTTSGRSACRAMHAQNPSRRGACEGPPMDAKIYVASGGVPRSAWAAADPLTHHGGTPSIGRLRVPAGLRARVYPSEPADHLGLGLGPRAPGREFPKGPVGVGSPGHGYAKWCACAPSACGGPP